MIDVKAKIEAWRVPIRDNDGGMNFEYLQTGDGSPFAHEYEPRVYVEREDPLRFFERFPSPGVLFETEAECADVIEKWVRATAARSESSARTPCRTTCGRCARAGS